MIEFNINKILVAVDFGPASLNALNTAIAMAKKHNARLLLLNVVERGLSDYSADGYNAKTTGLNTQNSELKLQALHKSLIERFVQPCEMITAAGIVSSSIIRISTEQQADIIIMGTNGEIGTHEFLIGSNAYNVIKYSACPVLTIPPEEKWESFKKILFPVRPISSALEKYDVLRKIIRKNEASLKILGMATDYEADVDFLKGLAMQLNEKLKEDHVQSSTYFKVGNNMADEVLKIATLMEADLIVITATIDSSIKQVFTGPYTRHIINHSRCPVLSIKPSDLNNHEMQMRKSTMEHLSQEVPLYN